MGKRDKSKEGKRKYLGYGYERGYGFGKRVALARNRAVEAIKKPVIEQEWQTHNSKMDGDSITIKILINRVLFKPTFINTGYEYYSIVDKNLIMELRFPRVKIPPKPIIGFVKENIRES